MGIKGWQTIQVCTALSVCCIRCMLQLGDNSWSWHQEIQSDDSTLSSAMIVALWMWERAQGEEDHNDMQDTSRYEKSGICLGWLGWEELGLVCYTPDHCMYMPYWGWYNDSHTKFTEVPVTHQDLPHLISSLCLSFSIGPSPKNTKLSHPSLSLHAMIKS